MKLDLLFTILDENHICYDIMPKEPVEETTMPVPQAEKESCGQYCQNNFDQLVYWSKNDEPVVCEIDDDYTNHYANYADHNESDTTVATYDRSLPNMNSDETDENGYSLYPTDNYHEDSAGETGCPSCIVQPYPVRVYTEEEAAHSSQARSYYSASVANLKKLFFFVFIKISFKTHFPRQPND